MTAGTLALGALGACDDAEDAPDARNGLEYDADGLLPDAGPPPLIGDEYYDPDSFERLGCVPGSVAALDPAGTWSLDTHTECCGGYVDDGAGAMKITVSESGTKRANVFEQGVTLDVRHTADDLFIRRVSTDSSGRLNILALDVCAVAADGTISGRYARCNLRNFDSAGELCIESSFKGVRLERIAGEVDAQGLSLLSEWRGRALDPWPTNGLPVNVRVKDGIAYLVSLRDGLHIVDLTNLAAPRDLSRVQNPAGYNDVKLIDRFTDGRRFALCSNDSSGIDAIDVSDPANPSIAASFPEEGSVHTMATETRNGQTRVYFPDGYTGGLAVWDVADPAAPVELGAFVHPDVKMLGGFIHDLSVADGIVYLNYWNLGFVVVDATDPTNIVQLGSYNDYERRTSHSNWVTTLGGCKVAVHGDEDYTAHLRLIGVDPSPACASQFMQKLGELSLRPEVSVHNILAFGTTAYVTYYQDGVRVFDLSNPAAPVQTAHFNTWTGFPGTGFFEGAVGIDVDLVARRIYVADIPRGLLVLSIDD